MIASKGMSARSFPKKAKSDLCRIRCHKAWVVSPPVGKFVGGKMETYEPTRKTMPAFDQFFKVSLSRPETGRETYIGGYSVTVLVREAVSNGRQGGQICIRYENQ